MAKSAEAFRTISEVADDLDVPKYVLRFWEDRFPQIRPMKRGGGRRYYRPEDMELLRGIRQLLRSEGYTIKGVQKILREQGVEHVKLYGRGPLRKLRQPRPSPQNPSGGVSAGPPPTRRGRRPRSTPPWPKDLQLGPARVVRRSRRRSHSLRSAALC